MGISDAARRWIDDVTALCAPKDVHFCDGSEEERVRLTHRAMDEGVLLELNQEKLPGCYSPRSHPNDVARTEHLTFICSATAEDAGPNNNWMAPEEANGDVGEVYRCARSASAPIV